MVGEKRRAYREGLPSIDAKDSQMHVEKSDKNIWVDFLEHRYQQEKLLDM